ncbi:MAG: TlpA disulfide reductase family protein [Ginsengibacter sp.]
MCRIKNILWLIILLAPLGSIAQGNYRLKGSFARQDISGKVFLNYKNGEEAIRDSAVVNKGNFVITGHVIEPMKALLELKTQEPGSKLTIERREIYLNNEQFSIKIKESLKNAELENSAINTEWRNYKKVEAASREELNNVIGEFRNTTKEDQADTAFISKRKLKLDQASRSLDSIMGDYVLQNPDNYFSFTALDQIAGPYMEAEKIESLFGKLSPRLQKGLKGKELEAAITLALTTSIGKIAPDFSHKDINGKEISLSQYRGKYVLLDFWASWCAPCRAENPNVVKAYDQYKAKSFTVLGLSVDREVDRDKWLKAVEEDALPWAQILDEAEKSTADIYSIKSIPANYLINPEGVIIAKNLRGKELHDVLEELLDK